MKKKKWFLALSLVLCLLLTGCSHDPSNTAPLTCQGLADTVQKAAAFAALTDATADYMEKYLMIDAAQLDGWVMRRDATRATPEMILVLQVKEGEDQAEIRQAVADYREEQLMLYRDYQPDHAFKLENAKVMEKGAFIVCIVSPDAAQTNAALGAGWKE